MSGLILIAEDNQADVQMIRRAFQKYNLLNPVSEVRDGAEVLAYLSGKGKYSDRSQYPFPELLMLDLRMPNKNGLEVLEWIQHQPELRGLPVVVLTASDQAEEMNLAFAFGGAFVPRQTSTVRTLHPDQQGPQRLLDVDQQAAARK